MTPTDADSISWLRTAFAFAFVLALMAGLAAIMKLAAARGFRLPGIMPRGSRLKVVESLSLDARRRLVVVKCDDVEHLLLLGTNQDCVVMSDIRKQTTEGR